MDINEFGNQLKRTNVRSGSGVPCSYFTPLGNYMYADQELDYVPASSEGEAVGLFLELLRAKRRRGYRPKFGARHAETAPSA